jgi:hypothetical protein
MNNTNFCPVCQENVNIFNMLNCRHIICTNCFNQYIMRFNNCPLCSTLITENTIINLNTTIVPLNLEKGENKDLLESEIEYLSHIIEINNLTKINNLDLLKNNYYLINRKMDGGNIIYGKFIENNENNYEFDNIKIIRRYDRSTYIATPSNRIYNLIENDFIYKLSN